MIVMGMKNPNPKRNSIIHVQNVILSELNNIVPNRETQRYIIAYEQKSYRVHYLTYKIAKELLRSEINKKPVDINIREDYRFKIKSTDTERGLMKNIIARIVPTRYDSIQSVYGKIITLKWRRTGKGGTDDILFNINECNIIANYNTITDVCYKKVSSQISGGGTHGVRTYIVISKSHGEYEVGKKVIISNTGKTYFEIPLRLSF